MGTNSDKTYGREFYADIQSGSRRSAREIVPLVRELTGCKSVVDIGCGTGEWLAVYKENGVDEILGIDGDYVDRKMLKIAEEDFRPFDLKQPLDTGRKFDLAMSVEVAEHLPESSAAGFVGSLVKLAPVVLFSASIPHQEGTHHVNEQWSDYWVGLFERHGYVVIDSLRPVIWDNENVDWWYKQNLLIFVDKDRLSEYPKLAEEYVPGSIPPRLVHPELLEYHVQKGNSKIVRAARKLEGILRPLIGRNG